MEINKNISLYANALIGEVVVANLNGNISNNGMTYNVGVTYTDKALINSTEENKAVYEAQYNLFVDTLKNQVI